MSGLVLFNVVSAFRSCGAFQRCAFVGRTGTSAVPVSMPRRKLKDPHFENMNVYRESLQFVIVISNKLTRIPFH